MARHSKIKYFCSLLIVSFIITSLFSWEIKDDYYGYSLDLIEGYKEVEGNRDNTAHQYNHENMPLTLVSKVYEDYGFFNSSEALDYALSRLSATGEISEVLWNNTNSCIASFLFHLDQDYSGWAISAPLGKDTYIVLINYAPVSVGDACTDFILSSLNSLCINDYFHNTPGLIATFTYPKEGEKEITVNINNTEIPFTMDKTDGEASQFVVDMEFRVLTRYASHPLMYEAWSRYYRRIYSDAYGRITGLSKAIYDTLYPIAEEKREDNPSIEYAQYLLSWVQNFSYVRAENKTESDFTSLPSIVEGKGSDCDSRSLLIGCILEYSGIDSLLLVYPEYSHAIVAANIKAPGQSYTNPFNKEEYIMGETTAKGVTWGTIGKEQADKSKCFAVILP